MSKTELYIDILNEFRVALRERDWKRAYNIVLSMFDVFPAFHEVCKALNKELGKPLLYYGFSSLESDIAWILERTSMYIVWAMRSDKFDEEVFLRRLALLVRWFTFVLEVLYASEHPSVSSWLSEHKLHLFQRLTQANGRLRYPRNDGWYDQCSNGVCS